jgi:hypothetical protein
MNGSQTVHERFMNIGYTNGALSHRLSSNDAPHPDDPLKNAARKKILHYRQLYADKTDPIIFLPVTVNTSEHYICNTWLQWYTCTRTSIYVTRVPGRVFAFMMTLSVCFSWIRTVRLVVYPEKYPRNLISFTFNDLYA